MHRLGDLQTDYVPHVNERGQVLTKCSEDLY